MSRHTSCTLSTENLLHNLKVVREMVPQAKIMAMIKANAYGHGLRSVGLRLDGHVEAMGVASIDEAMALRHCGVKSPITLIEGVFAPDELPIAAELNFHVVFHTEAQLKWLQESNLQKPIFAWLKIHTGMGRLGFHKTAAQNALYFLANHSFIKQPVGILSHFACSDEPSHEMNAQQIASFDAFTNEHDGPKSLCNSGGIFSFPRHHYDWVRPGIALYGASPLENCSAKSLGLKPVMSFHTRLIAVQSMKKGTSIGYGARFVCPKDMKIGIMAGGYGDGYPRSARDGTPILVNGVKCGIVGRVSMDMAAIDLSPCVHANVGDDVTLWGNHLPVESVAAMSDHINYDLLTGVQNRVKFLWT